MEIGVYRQFIALRVFSSLSLCNVLFHLFQILFTDFHTARDNDQVRIYTGDIRNIYNFYDYYAGDTLPDPLQFVGSNITVIYLTDNYFTRRGFSLEWKVHPTPGDLISIN